jgi:hypothetical protein
MKIVDNRLRYLREYINLQDADYGIVVFMSLGEELRNLDKDKIGEAIGSVLGRIFGGYDASDEMAGQIDENYQPVSYLVVTAFHELGRFAADLDEDQISLMEQGMTFLAAIVTEYAQLDEMRQRFPDTTILE